MEQNDLVLTLLKRIELLNQEIGALQEKLSSIEKLYGRDDLQEDDRFERVQVDLDMTDEFLYKKIEDCQFTDRTKNCLITNKILTVKGLLDITEKQLRGMRGFGKKMLAEVIVFLESHNLSIGCARDIFIGEDGKYYKYEKIPANLKKYWACQVKCVETGEIFKSVSECCKKMEIPYMTLYNCIKNGNGTRNGNYHFENV